MMNTSQKTKNIFKGVFFAVLGLLLMCNQQVQAQKINLSEYNWIFGDSKVAITFNKSDAGSQLDTLEVDDYPSFGMGGGAVISDPITGNLLFYTDGVNVLDANHKIVPNGGGLMGDANINQAASVVPMPFLDGEYYIFTNPGGSGAEIMYSVADRNLQGNGSAAYLTGDIDVARKNLSTGLMNPSEAMIVIQKDIDNYWVITNDRTTHEYQVLEINNGVIGTVQNFDLDDPAMPSFEASSFAYNAFVSKLAVAPKDAGRNVTLLDFDLDNGMLELDTVIRNTGNVDGSTYAVYDMEWSASGKNLYISRFGGAGRVGYLYQYNIDDSLATVNSVLPAPVFRSYGVQRGPDQNIYHLYQPFSNAPIEVGVIVEADSLYSRDSLFFNVGYFRYAFSPSLINGTQFPDFAAPHFEGFDDLSFFYMDTCATLKTKFFSNVSPTPTTYSWDYGDGESSNEVSPVYTYQTAGTYDVILSVELNGVRDSYRQTLTIVDNDLTLDLGMDTVRCPGETWTLDPGGNPNDMYVWNTGETTATITADTTNIYSVVVTSSATGCVNYAYVQIDTYLDVNIFRNQWYFGENAGIDFNPPGTTAIVDDNKMISPQGASTVSDLNGDLLFYTNGVSVWNKAHDVMVNGTNIGGDSTSSQGVMIVPLPRDSSIYYVFTSDPVYGDGSYDMKYSVVDMRKDTARGEVIQKDLSLFTNSTERMTALGLGSNTTWLVTHEFGNNQFRSYPLTGNGIGEPVTSAAGSIMGFDSEKSAKAQMKYAQSGGLLAVAFQDSIENYVELFQISDSTGQVAGLVRFDIQESTPALIYGVEFSSSRQKLYVSTNGNGSTLLQYDLDSLYTQTAKVDIEGSKFVLGTSSLEFGALQVGADDVIYLAVDGETMIGTIGSPNSDDASANFDVQGFDLQGRSSRLGLPNFVQEVPRSLQNPGISVTNPCLGQETAFSGVGTNDIIDEYFWSFDDNTFATVRDTVHTYNLSGTYNVTLRVTNRCGLDTLLLQPVDVFTLPATPTLQDAAALCNGPLTLEAWPVDTAAFSYTWSTGESTRTIVVSDPSLISVYITDTNGCQSDPVQSFIVDNRPIVDLGVDQIFCENLVITDLDALNPGSAYSWSVNGVANSNTSRIQPVDSSVPGVFTYSIEIEDINNCVAMDTVEYTIANQPIFTVTESPTSGCGNMDGTINISLTESGSFTYQITSPSTGILTALTGPTNAIISPLSPGGYTVNLVNILTGCESSVVATVDDTGAGFSIDTPASTPGCQGLGELSFDLSGTVNVGVDYELFDQFGNSIFTGTTSAYPILLSNLDSGTYAIEIQEQGGANCTQTLNNIVLNGLPIADYTTTPQNICGTEGEVSIIPVATGASYTWSGPGIVGSPSGAMITVSTTGDYTVVSSGAGLCPQTSIVSVTQNDAPDVSIDQQGQACDGMVPLLAVVNNGLVGNGSYVWDDGSQAAQRTVYTSGTYDVQVLDQGSGCIGTATMDVDVFNEITVFIAAAPNCDETGQVFLSAYANITEDVAFTWTDPTGVVLPDDGAEISIDLSGQYQINVASTLNVCEANANIDALVLLIADEELLLNEDEIFCSVDTDPFNSSVTLDAGAFSTYEWTIVNDDVILSTDRLFNVTEGGIYEVTVSNGFTCRRDQVDVRDDCAPLVHAPNAFTPDGNGLNDEFFVYPNPYVSDFSIEIYSRWGELVFQSNDVDFKWDGFYRGSLMKIDMYVYVMRYRSTIEPALGVIEQRGGVALIK